MEIALNIGYFSNPIVSETKKATFVTTKAGYFSRFLLYFLDKIKNRLTMYLDGLILAVEGFIPHIVTLSPESAQKELLIINKVFKDFYKSSTTLEKINYFDSPEIKEKYLYAIKLLNTTENKLHKAVYKNKPIVKAPKELIEGVARMNRTNLDKLLAV